jgi:hypothetical protein
MDRGFDRRMHSGSVKGRLEREGLGGTTVLCYSGYLFWLSFFSCLVLTVLFWLSLLTILSCSCGLVLVFMSGLPIRHGCPVQLSYSVVAVLPWQSWQSVSAVQSEQSYPGNPILAVQSEQSYPGNPILAVLSWQPSPGCRSWQFCPGCPHLADMSYLAVLFWPSYSDFIVLPVLFVFLCFLSFSGSVVLALFYLLPSPLSCSKCPFMSVLL